MNGCEKERQMYADDDDVNKSPIALEGFESDSTALQRTRSHQSQTS